MERKNKNFWVASVLLVLALTGTAFGYTVIEPDSLEELLLINISEKLNLSFDDTILFLDMMTKNATEVTIYNVTNTTVLTSTANFTMPDIYTKQELDSKFNLLLNEQKNDMIIVQSQLVNNSGIDQVKAVEQQLIVALAELEYQKALHDMEKEYLEASIMLDVESNNAPYPTILTESKSDEAYIARISELTAEVTRFETAKNSEPTKELSELSIILILAALVGAYVYIVKPTIEAKEKLKNFEKYGTGATQGRMNKEIEEVNKSSLPPKKEVAGPPKLGPTSQK